MLAYRYGFRKWKNLPMFGCRTTEGMSNYWVLLTKEIVLGGWIEIFWITSKNTK